MHQQSFMHLNLSSKEYLKAAKQDEKYTKCHKPTHITSLKVIQKYTYGKKSLSSELIYVETLYKL